VKMPDRHEAIHVHGQASGAASSDSGRCAKPVSMNSL
jgi:hypothetical protein